MDQNLRILILEDIPTDAELMAYELGKGGILFTSKRVETREEFIEALEEFRPDLILSDYRLPDFDGIAALEIVRERHPDIPFILVTGAMGEEFAIETLKKGATDYVLKERLHKLAPAVERAMKEMEDHAGRRKVEERLKERLEELERYKKATIKRELRMKELKERLEKLEKEKG